MKTLQKLLMLCLLTFSFGLTFTSCGDDDDDEVVDNVIDDNAPYTGVWKVTHVNVYEDGDHISGPMPSETLIKLTLYKNG